MLYFVFYGKKRMFHCRCKTRMRLDGLHLCVYSCVYTFFRWFTVVCLYFLPKFWTS